ncbi:hypothetical protein KY359_00585 [Candidatus Woesearchaeota archaeon]|nr:hypothetical protein [Candidatus Woesearchaeota archaeon]
MRKLLVVLMVLCFVMSLGCAKQSAPASSPEPAQPAPVPEMTQVQPEAAEEVAPPAPAAPPEPEAPKTLGTRVEGTEVEAVEQQVSDEEIEEIQLNSDKTMSSGDKTVTVGTTLAWKNYDSWPHQLAVETGKGFDTIRHAESPRLLEGGVFEYTFEEQGTFLVRDIFSGNMRMYVTVE